MLKCSGDALKDTLPTSDIIVEKLNYLDEGFDYSKIE